MDGGEGWGLLGTNRPQSETSWYATLEFDAPSFYINLRVILASNLLVLDEKIFLIKFKFLATFQIFLIPRIGFIVTC